MPVTGGLFSGGIISGLIAALGLASSAIVGTAQFMAEIAVIPFKLAGNNKMLATALYWMLFFIDAFFITPNFTALIQPFFDFFGITGIEIGFTSIYLLVVNIWATPIFGFYFSPFHLLVLATLLLLVQIAAWTYTHSKK